MVHVPYFHCPTSEFPFFSIYSYNFRPKINENTNSNNSSKHKQLNEGNYARSCTPRKFTGNMYTQKTEPLVFSTNPVSSQVVMKM